MSAIAKQLNTSELLRVAESGDVGEFARLLPSIRDVNARNRHGTTALMRAAYYGHEPMVRALLEHGADPNLTRNDRFTALALAAFFGHTNIVKTLIDFGAKTEAVTRCGASARTWATARTFAEVAQCLEKYSPTPVAPRPKVAVPEFVEPEIVKPLDVKTLEAKIPAVKTLSDPPEIWDLVHEAPRNFNPRSAFVARLSSLKRAAVGVSAGLVLMICVGIGVLVLRSSQLKTPPPEIPPVSAPVETQVSEQPAPVQAVVENPPVEVVNDNHSRTIPNRARLLIRQPRLSPVVIEEPVAKVENTETREVAAPKFESPKPPPAATKSNPNPALSPHLITPGKDAPAKGKVIQWP